MPRNKKAGQYTLAAAGAIENLLKSDLPEMMPLMQRLWPICRSITGPGVRETLDIIGELVSVERYSTPSGTQVFDWVVPPEWRIRDAHISDESGLRVVDFQENNLHVMGYSTPVDTTLDLEALEPHLHTIPEMPKAIPYLTSYYTPRWGFCLSQEQRDTLPSGNYHCVIDAELDEAGCLDFGQTLISGLDSAEVFFSTYLCHPSLANNELSGPVVQATLLSLLSEIPERRLGYRAAWTTETLGTLCYLQRFGETIKKSVIGGCVVSSVGDDGPFTWIRPRRGGQNINKVMAHVLAHEGAGREVDCREWQPVGSDERQYCSPGFNLPVGCFTRSHFEDRPEYHTSLDNLDLVSEEGLQRSLRVLLRLCQALEMNVIPVRTDPFGEPQLGKRGLYQSDRTSVPDWTERILFITGWADGHHDLIDIAEKAGKPVWEFLDPLEKLIETDLVKLEDVQEEKPASRW